jgi:hypothetical protein
MQGLMRKLDGQHQGCTVPTVSFSTVRNRQPITPPEGYEGYLSRRQAAARLGLASEFKVRQFEREGRLHAVRGRMGAAFYPEAEVLGLRAALARGGDEVGRGRWSDADLLALLGQPASSGRQRTAVDLVTEARVSIARAERVYRFWASQTQGVWASQTQSGRTGGAPRPQAGPAPHRPAAREATAPLPLVPDLPRVERQLAPPPLQTRERRSPSRVAHEELLRQMRDPDPRVRAAAFARLSIPRQASQRREMRMPSRRVEIEPELLIEIERIGKKKRGALSRMVNEALSVALAQRRRRHEEPVFTRLPRGRQLAERDEILSVLDF